MNELMLSDEEWQKTDEYRKIKSVIDNLIKTGMVDRLRGNCIGASDIVQNYLNDIGISAKIVEVKVSFIFNRNNQQGFYFLGYDNVTENSGQIDTHVVVITETKVPMLIDMSISNLLSKERPIIFERLSVNDPSVITVYDYGSVKITYRNKENVKYPQLHQKTILQRIVDERKHKEMLNFLKILVIVSITFSGFNFLMNMSLVGLNLHQIYVDSKIKLQGLEDGN